MISRREPLTLSMVAFAADRALKIERVYTHVESYIMLYT